MDKRIYAEDWLNNQILEIRKCGEVIRTLQRKRENGKEIVDIALKGVFLPVAIDFNKINEGVGFKFRNENNKDKFEQYKNLLVHIALLLNNFLLEEMPNEERYRDFLGKENDLINVLLSLDFSTIEEVSNYQNALKKRESLLPQPIQEEEPLRELTNIPPKKQDDDPRLKGRYVDEAA